MAEHRQQTDPEKTVRTTDLEPYITLRYIARLFKILAVFMMIVVIGEIILGFASGIRDAIIDLLVEVTRTLVIAGFLWAAGDLAILLIDAGHDLRVARILLGRINARLHRDDPPAEEKPRRVAIAERN